MSHYTKRSLFITLALMIANAAVVIWTIKQPGKNSALDVFFIVLNGAGFFANLYNLFGLWQDAVRERRDAWRSSCKIVVYPLNIWPLTMLENIGECYPSLEHVPSDLHEPIVLLDAAADEEGDADIEGVGKRMQMTDRQAYYFLSEMEF